MTDRWFAIPGKNRLLSIRELEAQLPQFLESGSKSLSSITAGSAEIKPANAPLEVVGAVPHPDQFNRLGGLVKAGVVLHDTAYSDLQQFLIRTISASEQSRYDIGISAYGPGWSARSVQALALKLKKQLKTSGKPVRVLLPQEAADLSAVVVQKQLLDKGGHEFVVWSVGGGVRVGRTVWVHQFEQWGQREFGKPDVDVRRGLLPQKLARIMVNLTGLKLDDSVTVFDPFCGSGVVLQEARELGCKVLGSDTDARAVRATKRNLGLLDSDSSIWQADARTVQIPRALSSEQLAIVTEPYLGPVWSTRPSPAELNRTVAELTDLYRASLRCWRRFLSVSAPVVMVFPVPFDTPTFPRIVDSLASLAYSFSSKPVRYERADTKVARDIVTLVTM